VRQGPRGIREARREMRRSFISERSVAQGSSSYGRQQADRKVADWEGANEDEWPFYSLTRIDLMYWVILVLKKSPTSMGLSTSIP